MIEQLMVQDYILFENAQIDFRQNMSVITGETGAGKSLLIDAIETISGGRAFKNAVRKGKEKAILQMVLSDPSAEVKEMLAQNGFDPEEDIILTRILSANGKSRMLVNSRVTTNSFVSKLVSKMVDVHSQMDTIRLLDPALQLELLDRFAKTEELKAQTAKAYETLHHQVQELRKLKKETLSQEYIESLSQQLEEIKSANVKPGELEELSQHIQEASDIQASVENLAQAYYFWKRDQGVSDGLYQAMKLLEATPTKEDFGEKIKNIYYELQDLFEQVENLQNGANEGAINLDRLQEREYLIKTLFRKYGGSYEALQQTYAKLNQQVDRFLHRQELFEKLEKERKEAAKIYRELAATLRTKRQAALPELRQQIEGHAKDLMLEHCQFDIRFENKPASKDGMDAIEFIASMNPGQPLTSIKQSASGGELARLMLALKVVFQAENGIGTLIFDEIDTGVSGKVALAMGAKMHTLAKSYQVLCITHLPSVAVWADDHYRVAKKTDGISTKTEVELLDERSHYEELAIMANGSAEPTAVESMKALSQRIKNEENGENEGSLFQEGQKMMEGGEYGG